jgi:hypothetical protein
MVCSSRKRSAAGAVVGQCVVAPPMSALATTLLVLGHGAMQMKSIVGWLVGGEWIALWLLCRTVEGHTLPGHDLL